MLKRIRSIASWTVVVSLILGIGFGAVGQRVAVFILAAAPVPAADLELLKNYANQRCAVIAGVEVATSGELMYAQRLTNTYVGNSITVDGMRRLSQTLDAHHIVILRLVRWENRISYKPERSLLLLGATSFLDASLQLLISPLGLLFGIDKEATVAILATVFSPRGDVEFSTTVTYADHPLLSLLTADPLEAAKGAIDSALYQVAVAL
jgi:hypothetical protein